MLAGAQEIFKKARRRAPPLGPESYRSLFIVGLLFPLHILLGLAAVPLVLAALFVWRSPWAWALAACYAPLYAQPAHRGSSAVPGWQSTRFARALWRWYDASTHCADYFARFEARLSRWTAARGDGAKQYVVAIHPHGLAIFSRTFWLTERVAFLARPWRMIGATALFYIPIVREFTLLFGAVGADRATFEAMLGTGANVVVYPGGLDKANDERYNTRKLHMKYRAPVADLHRGEQEDPDDEVVGGESGGKKASSSSSSSEDSSSSSEGAGVDRRGGF